MARVTREDVGGFVREHVVPVAVNVAKGVAEGKHPVSAGIQAATEHVAGAAHDTVHGAIHRESPHRGRRFLAAATAAVVAIGVRHLGEFAHDKAMEKVESRQRKPSS